MVEEDKKDKKDYSSVKYGVFMEQINTKLRRIMLTNPFSQKGELAELLKATKTVEKEINQDVEIDGKVKTDLVTRLDTFAWFMVSMLDEIGDLERSTKNKNSEGEESEIAGEDLDYFG